MLWFVPPLSLRARWNSMPCAKLTALAGQTRKEEPLVRHTKVTSHSISLAVVVHTWHTGESTSQKEALQWQSLTLVIAIIGHICACMYLHIRTHEHTPQTLLLFPACFQLPLHSSPLSFEAIVTLPLCLNCISPVSPLIVTLATYAQTTQHSLCLADNKDLCQWKTTVTA